MQQSKCISAARGRYGDIMFWNRDVVIGSAIAGYGEYFESEVDIFRAYVKRGDAVIDCGSNIGAHTMALASLVGPQGAVMAIEPQRPMFQVMCANAILNGYLNVHPVLAAAGKSFGHQRFIEPDYTQPNSYGGYETTPRAIAENGTATQIDRLDNMWVSVFGHRRPSFVKIDVEGSELDAIQGASLLLHRHRPVLYIENDRKDNSVDLIRLLRRHDYDLYWHIARFYNPNNMAGRADDMHMHRFGWFDGKINGASIMLLCLPKDESMPLPDGVRKVRSDDEYPPFE